ncbi:MAG: hypothetical protein ACRDT1_03380 [Micromonosporaceae bacterium]
MDYGDFHDLVESTTRGMYDRIPARYHEAFEIAFKVGELGPAVDQLLAGLVRFNIPIAPGERENLVRMLRYLDEPESRLDGVIVTTDGADRESKP